MTTTFVFKVTTGRFYRGFGYESKTLRYAASSAAELFDQLLRMKRLRWLVEIKVLRTRLTHDRGYVLACTKDDASSHRPKHCQLVFLDEKVIKAKRTGEGMNRLAEHVEEVASHCWEQALALAEKTLVFPKEGKKAAAALEPTPTPTRTGFVANIFDLVGQLLCGALGPAAGGQIASLSTRVGRPTKRQKGGGAG